MAELPALNARQDAIVRQHLPLVEVIARSCAPRLRKPLTVEDAVAEGRLGLIEASLRFDAQLGRTFAEFAKWRVKGAIEDLIRREATHERQVVGLMRKAAYERVAERGRGGNPLTDTDEQVRARLDDSMNAVFGSAFAAICGAVARVPGEEGLALQQQYAIAMAALRQILASLDPRERAVLQMKYFEERTLEQMAEALGTSVKAVRLLEGAAVERVGKRLRQAGVKAPAPVEGR